MQMKQEILAYNCNFKVTNLNYRSNRDVEIIVNSDLTLVFDFGSATDLLEKLEESILPENETRKHLQSELEESNKWIKKYENEIEELENKVDELEGDLEFYTCQGDEDDYEYNYRREVL